MTEAAKLTVGFTYSRSVVVTDDMTPAHLRDEPIRVLSTPDMIRLIEGTAIEAVKPHLAPGQSTVGTRVDVRHFAATPVGRQVVAGAQVTKVDGRRIEFNIEATDGVAPIGSGTHERMVIDMVRFVERLNLNSA